MSSVFGELTDDSSMEKEVHVEIHASSLSSFVDTDRGEVICFRCGHVGHVRTQCLTYKVKPCWHFERGACTDKNCTFAHGVRELRTPWEPKCVRVIKTGGTLVCIGCKSNGHTFRKCPFHKDMMFI